MTTHAGSNNRLLTAVAVALGILVSALSVFAFVETRSGNRAVLAATVNKLEKCSDDHEARLRIVEEAYREQRPVMRALARHFDIKLSSSRSDTTP